MQHSNKDGNSPSTPYDFNLNRKPLSYTLLHALETSKNTSTSRLLSKLVCISWIMATS